MRQHLNAPRCYLSLLNDNVSGFPWKQTVMQHLKLSNTVRIPTELSDLVHKSVRIKALFKASHIQTAFLGI